MLVDGQVKMPGWPRIS